MKNTCDCIIPFYNEGKIPLSVIKKITKIKAINKIIVVDDGSNDKKTYKKICQNFPQIAAIRLEKNTGKSHAVYQGLILSQAEHILLMDGDLIYFKNKEFKKVLQIITKNPQIDMIIIRLVADFLGIDWFRLFTLYSGQRILKRQDLLKIYKSKFYGFQLEAAINTYMVENKKNCYWLSSSIHHKNKIQKWGVFGALKNVLKLIKEIVNYTGWRKAIWQVLFFAKKIN